VTPTVSIGLPVRNGAAFMDRALRSLLAQTLSDFELIISDNASTDATPAIIAHYASQDTRIRVVRQDENLGAIGNFLFVLSEARGEYFLWAAADDEWKPTFLDRLVTELRRHLDAATAMCAVLRRQPDGTTDVVRWEGEADPGRMSCGELAGHVAAGRPYHLYICGLHRTPQLQQAARYLPRVQGPDRVLMCQAALAWPWRYVDEVLLVRQLSATRHPDRYPDESLAYLRTTWWSGFPTVLAAARMLLCSKVIPTRRKVVIPRLLFLFLKRALGRAVVPLRTLIRSLVKTGGR